METVRLEPTCFGCGPAPGVFPPPDTRVNAVCGDTLRLVSSEPRATVRASIGKIAEARGSGRGMDLPLRGLTGTFRIVLVVEVQYPPFWDPEGGKVTIRVRVRGCSEPRPEDMSTPDPRAWPTLQLTASGSKVKALLVSACATLANCWRGEPPARSLPVPVLDVVCGYRYSVAMPGVAHATVNGVVYPPSDDGVRATFPTASDIDYWQELRFEVRTPSMQYAVYRVNLAVARCNHPLPHEMDDLPGAGRRVSRSLIRRLGVASVALVSRSRDVPDRWWPLCSAEWRTLNGHVFVSTAAHCFVQADRPGAIPREGSFEEFTPDEPVEYAIAKRTPSGYRISALVEAVYVYSGVDDLAVVIPAPSQDVALERLAALPLHTGARTPAAGQQAVAISYPAASHNRLVTSVGVYLGRVRYPEGTSRTRRLWDIVGIRPRRPHADACNYGGSGSTAILADGTVLGALGRRGNAGYPYGGRLYPPDGVDTYLYILNRLVNRLLLFVPERRFSTLCSYSVPPAGATRQIEQLFGPPPVP